MQIRVAYDHQPRLRVGLMGNKKFHGTGGERRGDFTALPCDVALTGQPWASFQPSSQQRHARCSVSHFIHTVCHNNNWYILSTPVQVYDITTREIYIKPRFLIITILLLFILIASVSLSMPPIAAFVGWLTDFDWLYNHNPLEYYSIVLLLLLPASSLSTRPFSILYVLSSATTAPRRSCRRITGNRVLIYSWKFIVSHAIHLLCKFIYYYSPCGHNFNVIIPLSYSNSSSMFTTIIHS